MKKIWILLIFIFFFSALNCRADEVLTEDKIIEEYSQDESINSNLNSLYTYIDNMKTDIELINDLNPVEYIKSYIKNGKGNISFSLILKSVVSLIFKEVKTVLKLSLSIIIIAILCSLLKNIQDALSSDSISNIAFYACYLVLILILSKSFLVSISIAKEAIYGISAFMNGILPILVSIIALSGGVMEVATLDPIILVAVLIIPKIYVNIIIPLILISFVLEFANNLSEEHKINNLCKTIKQITLWLQGGIITIFIATLTIRGITSSTIDAVTLKTTKFAIDNFIPIVGKAFSDAISSVVGYSLIIKNAISSMGLLILVLIILYPIIKIVLISFIYKMSAALTEPISDKRITSSIEGAGNAMVLLLSCILSVSLMFFVLFAIIASAGKFIVGG